MSASRDRRNKPNRKNRESEQQRERKALKEYIKRLSKIVELKSIADLVADTDLTRVNKAIDFHYNKWTILKLIALLLYTPLYLSIINRHFKEYYYIDLFAGTGMGYIEYKDSIVQLAGSSLIALAYARPFYSGVHLVELDPIKIRLLKARVERLAEKSKRFLKPSFLLSSIDTDRIKYHRSDANNIIFKIYEGLEERNQELISRTRKGVHSYLFIDPTGMQLRYEALKRILTSHVRADMFILFNSYTVGMQAYNHMHQRTDRKGLDKHLGRNWYSYLEKHPDVKDIEKTSKAQLSKLLSDYYMNLLRANNRNVVVRIKLPLKLRANSYDLFFVTRRTKGGNPYLNGVIYIKDLIYKTEYKFIDHALQYIITGRLPSLIESIIQNVDDAVEEFFTYRRFTRTKGR